MRAWMGPQGLATFAAIALLAGGSLGLLATAHQPDGPSASSTASASSALAQAPAKLPSKLLVAGPPKGAFGPDDLTYLPPGDDRDVHGTLWTAYQNGIGPTGTASASGAVQSTIAGYDPSTGALVTSLNVSGHVDGLTADPSAGVLLATANEDSNSSFYLIHPWTGVVVRFAYTPSPAVNGNGGTDSIALWHGGIYVSHSNPNDTAQATVFKLQLDWSAHAARLYPVFWDDSVARFEPAGSSGRLALTDPDTNFVMPRSSARFAGDLATISQGDGRLIFASPSLSGGPRLTQLNLTDNRSGNLPPVDGLAETTSRAGTLYVVDSKANTITALSTTGWSRGTIFIGEPSDNGNPLVGTLNLWTGHISPLGNSFLSPKGMFFLPASGTGSGHGHDGSGSSDHHHGHSDGGGRDGMASQGPFAGARISRD